MKDQYLAAHYNDLGHLNADFRNANLFRVVSELVTGKNVVDVGCGTASLIAILKNKGHIVAGIEPNADLRALATKLNPGVPVIPGTAEEITTLVRPVDTVIMVDVLEHIENDFEQVRKVGAVLQNKGEFIFVVPAYPFLFGQRDKEMGHYRRYTKKGLAELLTKNGFSVKSMRHWNMLGVLPYFVSETIFKRPLQTNLRGEKKLGFFGSALRSGLNWWFRVVENNVDLGFGLSIIGVAKKAS